MLSRFVRLGAAVRAAAAACLLAGAGLLATGPAHADLAKSMRLASADPSGVELNADGPTTPLIVDIDLTQQKMSVYIGDQLEHVFAVSTARSGYITPPGDYQPQWMTPFWRSKKYNNAPMPWSVFFHGGYAIHGTTDIRHLGKPASHGCVRLHPDNAKLLFRMVEQAGMANTKITITR